MLRILLVAVLFAGLSVIGVSSALCTLKINKLKPGVFTVKFGYNTMIYNPSNGTIQFDDRTILDAYCSSGFKQYSNLDTKLQNRLTYSCSVNTVRYQVPGNSLTYAAKNDGSLSCDKESDFYSQTVQYCKNTGLAYGFNIGNSSVSFADICYDFRKNRADFIHYTAGVRNELLEDQYILNPNNNSNALPVNKVYNLTSTILLKERQTLPVAINRIGGNYPKLMNYYMDNLIPIRAQAGIMESYVMNFQNISAIAWWSNLLDINWQQLQYRIGNLSYMGWYEVYAGTSDSVTIPFENRIETFSYTVDGYNRTLPLYVWNFIRNKNDKKDTGVVVIGVNSPFFAGESSSAILCKDTCDKVTWMNPLKNTRKIPSMGYIFCCAPNDVKKRLDGFPQI